MKMLQGKVVNVRPPRGGILIHKGETYSFQLDRAVFPVVINGKVTFGQLPPEGQRAFVQNNTLWFFQHEVIDGKNIVTIMAEASRWRDLATRQNAQKRSTMHALHNT